jgi:hypothetical protein
MSTRRLLVLIAAAALLFLVMMGAQIMLAARNTLLQPAFLERSIAAVTERLSAPGTHEQVIRSMVEQVLGSPGADGLSGQVREHIVESVRTALTPQWIQTELTLATHAALSVLRGRERAILYTVDLASRKEIVAGVLSTRLSASAVEEMQGALASIPDRLPIEAIVGAAPITSIQTWGRLFIPLSILLVFVGPAALLITCQMVGGFRHGLWVAGTVTLGSGLAVLAALTIAARALDTRILERVLGALPPTLAWLEDEIEVMAAEVRRMATTISVSFALVGGSIGASGVAVAMFARRVVP